jgi:2,4-dienoyl-CoA reductase-like NADH-dependent reductase (Old Yellow Enzyme family)/thioredoxin reductase
MMSDFNKYKNVFSPIQIGRLTLKNRIQFSPMVCCLTTSSGDVTNEYIEFLGMQARTGAGLVTIGASPMDHETGIDVSGELDVTHDDKIPGLMRISEEVHRYGAKLSVELVHGGRGADPHLLQTPYALAPTPLPTHRGSRYVKEMDQLDIDHIVNGYAEVVNRLALAKFDMAMIHAAHGNLIAQFLSPYTNKRNDYYGGSFETRIRFPLEILQAIREKVGDRIALEMRVSGDELLDGSMHIEEVIEFIKRAQKYIDLIHISAGIVVVQEGVFHTMPPYYHPHCHNVKYAQAVKNDLEIKIPVTTVGSITSIKEAEEIIATGKADIVAMARQLMADPETLKKAYRGDEASTRPCLRCFEGCAGNAGQGAPVRCSVNPVIGREIKYREIAPARKQKKVVVVGGGTAGMMATQVLVERGHDVILFEKAEKLGSHLHEISVLPFKQDLRKYLQWNVATTMKCGAKILLNTEATPEAVMNENPDALVIASGSTPRPLNIPGINGHNVYHVLDVDNGRVKVGNKVVVCGGGVSGMECALALAMEGKAVTVVDLIPVENFACDMMFITRTMLLSLLNSYGVKYIGNSKIRQFKDNGVEIEDRNWVHATIEADTIVTAFGMKENRKTVDALCNLIPETYVIGDCESAKNIHYANHTAFNYAVEI